MKWILTKDQLPKFNERVLVWDSNEPDEPGSVDELEQKIETNKGFHYKWRFGNMPTHWMPLPEKPIVPFVPTPLAK